MEYKINPTAFGSMFPMPVSIADEHIKFAGTMQLRVILWLFRHCFELPVTPKKIATELNMAQEEVADIMEFWIKSGIVLCDEQNGFSLQDTVPPLSSNAVIEDVAHAVQKTDIPQEQDIDGQEQKKITVEKIHISQPTHEEVGRRIKESSHIREMMQEAELRLGTLSCSMQSTLVSLHDDYGLPVEVICYLIEFLRTNGRVTTSRIASEGRKWCEMGICDIDSAEEYIENHGAVEKAWSVLREEAKIKNPSLSKKQRDFFETWVCKMKFSTDMLLLAYDEMIEHTGNYSFPYMDKILTSWYKLGIRTVSQAKKAKTEHTEKKADTKPPKDKKNLSYNVDAYMEKAFQNPLNRKKENNP